MWIRWHCLGRAWAGWVALWCCWGRVWGNGAFWEISRPVGAVALEKTIEGLGRFRGRCYYIFGENLRFVWKYWDKLIPGGFYPNRMGVKSQLWKWWLLWDVDAHLWHPFVHKKTRPGGAGREWKIHGVPIWCQYASTPWYIPERVAMDS